MIAPGDVIRFCFTFLFLCRETQWEIMGTPPSMVELMQDINMECLESVESGRSRGHGFLI